MQDPASVPISDFNAAVAFVLAREGGYSVDPADPGGETNFGISKRSYPSLDIKNLTVEDAKAIYLRDFWTPLGCDMLDQPAALAVLDCGVNLGVHRATALWQAANGDVEELLWARLAWYDSLTSLQKFLPGWVKRLLLLREAVYQSGG